MTIDFYEQYIEEKGGISGILDKISSLNQMHNNNNNSDVSKPNPFLDTKKASYLRDAIVANIGFDDAPIAHLGFGQRTGLVKYSVKDPDLTGISNASYALLEFVLGDAKSAEKFKKRIKGNIGCNEKTGLIHYSNKSLGTYTHTSSCYALLEFILGNTSNAKAMRNSIQKNIGYSKKFDDQGKFIFIKGSDVSGSSEIYTFPNSCYAMLQYALDDISQAQMIRQSIKSHIGFYTDNGLVRTRLNAFRPTSAANSSYALLEYFLGDTQKAQQLKKGIEEHIGFDDNTGLAKSGEAGDLYTNASTFYALLCVADKFKQAIDKMK